MEVSGMPRDQLQLTLIKKVRYLNVPPLKPKGELNQMRRYLVRRKRKSKIEMTCVLTLKKRDRREDSLWEAGTISYRGTWRRSCRRRASSSRGSCWCTWRRRRQQRWQRWTRGSATGSTRRPLPRTSLLQHSNRRRLSGVSSFRLLLRDPGSSSASPLSFVSLSLGMLGRNCLWWVKKRGDRRRRFLAEVLADSTVAERERDRIWNEYEPRRCHRAIYNSWISWRVDFVTQRVNKVHELKI